MPAPTNSQKIDDLIRATSRLEENLERFRGDLDRGRDNAQEVASKTHQLEIQFARMEEGLKYTKETYNLRDLSERIARLEEGLEHAREKLDRRDSRRFELIKILVSAILAAIIANAANAGYQWLSRTLEAKASQQGSPAEKKP